MATLEIDEKTYRYWSLRAKASGQTVEEWLKAVTSTPSDVASVSKEERLRRFDEMMKFVKEQNVRSISPVDDSRDTIYGERG
ncbi:hypothetical protein [Lacunimicrobium album]